MKIKKEKTFKDEEGRLDQTHRVITREANEPFVQKSFETAKTALETLSSLGFCPAPAGAEYRFLEEHQMEDHPQGTHTNVIVFVRSQNGLKAWVDLHGYEDAHGSHFFRTPQQLESALLYVPGSLPMLKQIRKKYTKEPGALNDKVKEVWAEQRTERLYLLDEGVREGDSWEYVKTMSRHGKTPVDETLLFKNGTGPIVHALFPYLKKTHKLDLRRLPGLELDEVYAKYQIGFNIQSGKVFIRQAPN